jgi:hypothetical protein
MFQFDADNTLTSKGVWKSFKDSEFLIAHTSNLKFQRALTRLQQPYTKKLQNGTLDPKVNQEIICQALSEGILLDWRKVVNSAKEIVEYKPELGKQALIGDVEFREFVSEISLNLDNFRKEELEEVGKA